MDKGYIIENKLIGLYSLLPLMKVRKNETPDAIMEEAVSVIETIEDDALKGDVLTAMSILSSEKFSSELVKKYIRREMLMNSPLFEEWVKEEREEAAKKARELAIIATTREKIIDVLTERFEYVPENIIEGINNIESLTILDQLFTRSIKTVSLDEFGKLLNVVTKK